MRPTPPVLFPFKQVELGVIIVPPAPPQRAISPDRARRATPSWSWRELPGTSCDPSTANSYGHAATRAPWWRRDMLEHEGTELLLHVHRVHDAVIVAVVRCLLSGSCLGEKLLQQRCCRRGRGGGNDNIGALGGARAKSAWGAEAPLKALLSAMEGVTFPGISAEGEERGVPRGLSHQALLEIQRRRRQLEAIFEVHGHAFTRIAARLPIRKALVEDAPRRLLLALPVLYLLHKLALNGVFICLDNNAINGRQWMMFKLQCRVFRRSRPEVEQERTHNWAHHFLMRCVKGLIKT
mmetsp:Transcript_78057/g.173006  ORF Transcript_78057/g.173006 Transcript_78057/m.173006 type:complete len:294 (+) Transcript_78057:152-1033(+)